MEEYKSDKYISVYACICKIWYIRWMNGRSEIVLHVFDVVSYKTILWKNK